MMEIRGRGANPTVPTFLGRETIWRFRSEAAPPWNRILEKSQPSMLG